MSGVETLFDQALALSSPAERSAFLARACEGNAAVRQEIEDLLAAHERAGQFLEVSAIRRSDRADGADSSISVPLPERAGVIVGNYKLLEQIGEGGMGIVFMAEQLRPVQRRVALKIIKPGMDTRRVIARFEAERQALAMMDHPNIAKVFDAGTTDAGRPYFVMELVRGVPITDYCDQQKLPPRQRLELFVQVCQAVQHAHQKGIIHRDLKPNNVLITLADDGTPVPKVIDFGIAKAITGQRLTEQTLFTEFRLLVGTPLYMSPEQAEMNALQDVDTRSDVYSLGVLLYELLTGTTPFDKKRLADAAFDEVRRILREEEPPRPSTRLSALGQTVTGISAQRQTDPRKLGQAIRGELDWIVMKALEKDRGRRYDTANEFAADVGRYLSDLPVAAGPPSRIYRLRKSLRRNRAAIAMAGVIAGVLIAGTAVSAWQAHRAKQAALMADKAEREMKSQRDRAVAEKQRIDQKITTVNQMNWFYGDMQTIDPTPADVRSWRAQAEWCFQDLPNRTEYARSITLQLIKLYRATHNRTEVERWTEKFRQVLESDIATATHDLELTGAQGSNVADLYARRGTDQRLLGRFRESLSDYEKAHEHMAAPDFPQSAMLQLYLGDDAGYRRTCRRISLQYDPAHGWVMAALTVQVCTISRETPVDLAALRKLADQAVEHSDGHEIALLAKGMLEYQSGEDQAAIDVLLPCRAKLAVGLANVGSEPTDTAHLDATAAFFLAMVQERLGQHALAQKALTEARLRLHQDIPDASSMSEWIGEPRWLITQIASRRADEVFGRQAVAATRPTSAPATNPAAPATNPAAPRPQEEQAIDSLRALANSATNRKDFAAADQYYLMVLSLQRSVPGVRSTDLAYTLTSRAKELRTQKKLKDAETSAREAIAILRSGDHQVQLSEALRELGYDLRGQKRYGEALAASRESLELHRRGFGPKLLIYLTPFADDLRNTHRYIEAEGAYREAIEVQQRTSADATQLGQLRAELGRVLRELGKFREAEPVYRLVYMEFDAHPTPPNGTRWWGNVWQEYAISLADNGKMDEAEAVIAKHERRLRAAGQWTTWEEGRSITTMKGGYRRLGMRDKMMAWDARVLPVLQKDIDAESAKITAGDDPAAHYHQRGILNARLGQFQPALRDFEASIKLKPDNVLPWYLRGCILAYLRRDAEYAAHCREMMAQYPQGTHQSNKTVMLLPGYADPELMRVLVEQETRGLTDDWAYLNRCLAAYRRGGWEQCLREGHLALAGQERSTRGAADEFLICMASEKLGRHDEALAALNKGQAILDICPGADEHDLAGGWNIEDWLIAQVIAREARALLPSADAPATRPLSSVPSN